MYLSIYILHIMFIHENRGGEGGIPPLKKNFMTSPPKISRPPSEIFWPPYVVKFS